jgi:acylphosphatase
MIALRLIVRGGVQGVGYRYSAVQAAQQTGVAGWVRNRGDGSVEAHAQGERAAVEAFVAWCRHGPAGARVADVAVQPAAADPTVADFETRPTVRV